MYVNEVEPGCGAPVSKQARLYVLELERFFQQRIVVAQTYVFSLQLASLIAYKQINAGVVATR